MQHGDAVVGGGHSTPSVLQRSWPPAACAGAAMQRNTQGRPEAPALQRSSPLASRVVAATQLVAGARETQLVAGKPPIQSRSRPSSSPSCVETATMRRRRRMEDALAAADDGGHAGCCVASGGVVNASWPRSFASIKRKQVSFHGAARCNDEAAREGDDIDHARGYNCRRCSLPPA
ncbi:hypothetical protein ZWY2020_040884 [Hordeum vulgare]|nr:hypothetical protein ZWY2020_040884 [Hordeum vulgare]